jgi:hypothetical protein
MHETDSLNVQEAADAPQQGKRSKLDDVEKKHQSQSSTQASQELSSSNLAVVTTSSENGKTDMPMDVTKNVALSKSSSSSFSSQQHHQREAKVNTILKGRYRISM